VTARTAPTVTVAVPVLNEADHIGACLDAIDSQTYTNVVEVLVIDGGSSDGTPALAERPGVRVLHNPRRIQAAALNRALEAAKGDVLVRVDGHCVIAPDYVERCVDALERTGAAMVGGAMTPVAEGWKQRGVAAAMASSFGAGPARFHVGGDPGWVDTVYLGAYRVDTVTAVGGYREVDVNEDAELAVRLRTRGRIWFDPAIRSTYAPRESFAALSRQFYRYGRGRAATVRAHPTAIAPRQLAAPALVVGLLSRRRRLVAVAYACAVAIETVRVVRRRGTGDVGFALAAPVMHLSWGVGFIIGMIGRRAPIVRAPSA
jgi:glycosyltransferase involved in cell wall biosynthesis